MKSYRSYNPQLKVRARELRKNSTLSEVLLWQQLKGRQLLGYKFRRQVPVGNYIVDFHCKELALVVEVDGISHDFKIEYDKKRDIYLQNVGLTVLRFNDIDIKKDSGTIIQRIVDWIDGTSANPPRSP